jgi:hypothetical protein
MSKNFWDDQEPFRDGAPQLVDGKWQEPETYTPAPENTIQRKAAPRQQSEPEEMNVEELTEQVAQEDDEEDFESVLSDARLRLEQGKLYEMLMNHDLFEGVEADPKAAKSVQRQIRGWAKTQMEIMLGMRQEQTIQNTIVSSPFNELEVTILKKLASAASKGATESEEANISTQSRPEQPPKKKTLNTLGSGTNKTKPVTQPKPIQKKVEPIQRPKQNRQNLPPEMEPDYEPLSKPLHEMTSAELVERDKEALERQRNRKAALPPDRVPMPDYAQQEMMATMQVSRAVGNPTKGNLSAMIMANLKGAGKI